VSATTSIAISRVGLSGTLRLTWVRDNLAHVLGHAATDETTGTWTGQACPDRGLRIGSDVDAATLTRLCAGGEVADLIWEAPGDLAAEHDQAYGAAMSAYSAGNHQRAESHWSEFQAIWSRAWTANQMVLGFMQETGIERFAPARPQRWVVASFEHHSSPHGAQQPHVHNIVVTAMTR
jgi:hypothetical protein